MIKTFWQSGTVFTVAVREGGHMQFMYKWQANTWKTSIKVIFKIPKSKNYIAGERLWVWKQTTTEGSWHHSILCLCPKSLNSPLALIVSDTKSSGCNYKSKFHCSTLEYEPKLDCIFFSSHHVVLLYCYRLIVFNVVNHISSGFRSSTLI